jgi:hypothetical protein
MGEEVEAETWLTLPASWNILLINTPETLTVARYVMDSAYLCTFTAPCIKL